MEPLIELNLKQPASSSTPPESSNWSVWNSVKRFLKRRTVVGETFYGPGSQLRLDRGVLDSPLVYVCPELVQDEADASLIELELSIAPAGASAGPLPYWPSYRGASPAQRSKYLDWLVSGRSNPETDVGYVFLYFYGLERRVLIDGTDHPEVAAELLRLLSIYGHSASFRRYAQSLLWTTIWLSRKAKSVPYQTVSAAITATEWTGDTLNVCLACFAGSGRPLPDELIYHLVRQDVRSPRTVIVQRHQELHKQAFFTRLRGQLPEGVHIKTGKRDRRLDYFPASATLGRVQHAGGPLAGERVPSLLGSSQFNPLLKLWEQAVEDLRGYDKAQKKANGAALTAEMYEALPEHLRQGDHPHFDQWCQLLDRSVTEDGWTIVTIGDFAALEGIAERPKLTKTQSLDLAKNASQMGFALEPDIRITGKPYHWTQQVSVFPATDELSQDVAAYHAAAVLLELGVGIAAADGILDEIELGRLTSHLESQFELSSQDSCRLEHLRYLLVKSPPMDFALAKSMQAKLNRDQRKKVGEFLVGIAAADEQISAEEIKALTTAYRALGLAKADLDQLLRPHELPPALTEQGTSSAPTFRLDLARITAIMAETKQVTEFLREAMRDSDDELTSLPAKEPPGRAQPALPVATTPANLAPVSPNDSPQSHEPLANRWPDLPRDLHPFLQAATAQSLWSRATLDQLARTHRLMLGSAIERINEWAYDRLGDALFVEDSDSFLVQVELFK
jgi:tellurite resistance protein